MSGLVLTIKETYHDSCEKMKHSGIAVYTLESLETKKVNMKHHKGNQHTGCALPSMVIIKILHMLSGSIRDITNFCKEIKCHSLK